MKSQPRQQMAGPVKERQELLHTLEEMVLAVGAQARLLDSQCKGISGKGSCILIERRCWQSCHRNITRRELSCSAFGSKSFR